MKGFPKNIRHPVVGEVTIPLHLVWHRKGKGVVFMGVAGIGGEGTAPDGRTLMVRPALGNPVVQFALGSANDPDHNDHNYLIDLRELAGAIYEFDRKGKSGKPKPLRLLK